MAQCAERHAWRAPVDPADERLRQALLGLPAEGAEARLDGLNGRVLSQWEAARHAAAVAGRSGRPWLALWGRGGRASWAAGAAGLMAALALVMHTWLRTPDPALEELLQPDVLSQMAAGEM